jgi:hypothetical protein
VKPAIGRKYETPLPEGPDPFQYDHQRGLKLTKDRSKSAVFHNKLGRLNKEADPSNGPGTFNAKNNFGEGLKNMTIGRKSASQSPERELGPGYYNHQKGDKLVKPQNPSANFEKRRGRATPEPLPDNIPITYSNPKPFGQSQSKMTIGVRREDSQENRIGPGEYAIEKGEKNSQAFNKIYRHEQA